MGGKIAFSGIPNKGEQNQKSSPTKGNKIRSGCLAPAFSGAQKRAEVQRHPCVLGGPQTRGQSQRCPTSGRKCYVTPTFSGVPEKGFKSGPCRAPGKNPIVGVLKGGP